MAESKSAPDALEVLRKTMDEIARQIGAMDAMLSRLLLWHPNGDKYHCFNGEAHT
jgi:hypothetical protein